MRTPNLSPVALILATLTGCDADQVARFFATPDLGPDAATPDAAALDGGTDAAADRGPPLDAAPLDLAVDAGFPTDAASDAAEDARADAPDAAEPAPDAFVPGPPPGPNDRPRFAFPVDPADRALINSGLMFGVDHDDAPGRLACTAFDGDPFPACYGGHEGSDFVLLGGFRQMDEGSARAVAAAAGRVTRAEDGNYDRCHGSAAGQDVSCDGEPMRANQVEILHANGWRSRYLHFKKNTVAVQVGDEVGCGDFLAELGSSGNSTLPHLHFEVSDPQGQVVDPFAVNPALSLWTDQRADDVRPGQACDPSWGPRR